jgi:Domain of unknown function (DUF4129)
MDRLSRAWTEWMASVEDFVGASVPTMMLVSIVIAGIVGVLWYFWPRWLTWPWSWGSGESRSGRRERRRRAGRRGLGRLRWRLRRRRKGRVEEDEAQQLPDDQVPDLPAEVLALNADELAAAGRYAEAVRERLRAMVRGLIERGLLPVSPGWTVMELAAAGGRARPAMAGPLNAAAGIFSEIWYGLRPATAGDDAAMRTYATAVAAIAEQPEPEAIATGRGA